MLYGILIGLQLLISILLVISILLQSSKGGGLAGVAGGLATSTVFGGRSAANFLTRATSIMATIFFVNCLVMAVMSSNQNAAISVTQQQAVQTGQAPSPVPPMPTGATEQPVVTPEGTTTIPVTTQPTQTQPNTGGTETK